MNDFQKHWHEGAQESQIQWRREEKQHRGADLLKNMAVAASLVLCAVTLKQGALPVAAQPTDALLAAMSSDTILDDQLGKLTFVSSLFPEATLVFGEQGAEDLAWPVLGGTVIHAWSEAEPYMAWNTSGREVFAAGEGVVMGVYHGENEERIVQLRLNEQLTCMYGNLIETTVAVGDRVQAGEVVGLLNPGMDCVMEVFQNGISIDPTRVLGNIQ